ncbi:telomere binding protein [Neofusicoccum ribis]|uniref:Telomere binding protein n=1 Tax=Neofusicoccum ribis TaxID=45134 RepID=A0ABR3T7N4_9PEZI
MLQKLRTHEQRQYLFSFLNILSKRILAGPQVHEKDPGVASKKSSSSAALLQAVTSSSDALKESLVAWLISPQSGNSSVSFATRRVAIATLQSDEDRMCKVMERSMEQFGDELFIKHTPILQQEAVAISELVDKPENRLKFDIPETESAEANWYRQLVNVHDAVGSIQDFEQPAKDHTAPRSVDPHLGAKGTQRVQKTQAESKKKPASGLRIIEIIDDSGEDDDLIPYAKPDSDPEDESEDPTQVTRNKPTAPVYIRDLLAGIREHEDYDRHQLALSTAASLIRRKTNFGKEVKDNVEELASVLIGLNDQLDLENFQEMRQQALIAVVLAEPAEAGPFLVRSFYAGDYSFSQRVAILTAIGLGAREMAGFKDAMEASRSLTGPGHEFPTKMLPEKLHRIYSADQNPVDAITNQLKQTMISPLAVNAADKVTGPNALKVRTFSSRMEVEKKRKVITNELAKVVAQSFFFPLTGGWWTHAKTLGTSNIYYSPMILPIFLKTLAILLHSSGTSTLSLPQMTSELWDLLLSVRTPALTDAAILESVLFAFLTLLEVNEDQQRLVQEHSKELLETQEWVKLVFDRTGGGSDEEERQNHQTNS